MKKEWVKREHMYYKPFYKQKAKVFLLVIFLFAIAFFIYEIVIINNLPLNQPKTTYSYYYNYKNKPKSSPETLKTDPDKDNHNDKSLEIIRWVTSFQFYNQFQEDETHFHEACKLKVIGKAQVTCQEIVYVDKLSEFVTVSCNYPISSMKSWIT